MIGWRRSTQSAAESPGALVREALSGNGAAFQRLVDSHTSTVYGIGWAYLQQQEAAEEFTQEVFLRAWVKLPELREPERFSGWLTRLARNEAVSWLRRNQSRSNLTQLVPLDETMVSTIMADPNSSPRKPLEEREQEQVLAQALAKLSPEERELLHLHYTEELTQREIAERWSVHHTTVSRQLTRVLGVLRGLLGAGAEPKVVSPAPSPRLKRRVATLVAAAIASPAVTGSLRAEVLAVSTATPASSTFIGTLATGITLMSTAQKLGLTAAVLLLGLGGVYTYQGSTERSTANGTNAPIVSTQNTVHQEVTRNFYGEQVYDVPLGQTHRINFPGENPEGIQHLLLTANNDRTLTLYAQTNNGPMEVIIDPRNPNPEMQLSHVQVWPERNLCYVLAASVEESPTGMRLHFFAANKPELLPAAKAIETEYASGKIPKAEVGRRVEALLIQNGLMPTHPLTKAQIQNILRSDF
ncbi:MAG: sigma-70 family RNA polymerase sigma factor [Candidatus Sumerlaeia bacterium]|nr:sigma-70 family RNA polymerase sigma factor [Candidatus Sumerlaeia bacterium]